MSSSQLANEPSLGARKSVATVDSITSAPLTKDDASNSESNEKSFIMRWLTTLTVLGVLVGAALGVTLNFMDLKGRMICEGEGAKQRCEGEWVILIGFPGVLFIRALKALAVPMIFCSMVTSTSSMSSSGGGIMARWAILFYLSTTMLAALTGLVLFNCFHSLFQVQDVQLDPAHTTMANVQPVNLLESLINFGKDFVPDNVVEAFLKVKLLGVITFGMFFGYTLTKTSGGVSVISWFCVCSDTLVAMVRAIIPLTPIGVGSLVAKSVADVDDFGAVFTSLGLLVLVVIAGQLFHVFVTYAGLYMFFTKKNPYSFLAGLPQVWMTAFGTSSSAATLSTTQAACERLGVSRQVSSFVLPIGCTVNMDGSALEKPIVILFIAYVSSQSLDFTGQFITALTSVLLSIGGSPIPSAGITTIVVMLETVGVHGTPTVDRMVSFILAIEWFLDGIRTAVNCTGDSMGAGIIDHRMRHMGLIQKDEEEEECELNARRLHTNAEIQDAEAAQV